MHRTENRTDLLLTNPLEELLVIPDGVAWTEPGEVWVLHDDAEAPTLVIATTDPHGITTDGQSLYWVGHSKVALTQPGVTTLCFCGSDLCTVADGTLRRHAGTSVKTLAETGEVTKLSCTADRIGWSGPVGEGTQITVLKSE